MGKIGPHEYPDIDPEEALSITKTILDHFGDKIEQEEREKLAGILGHEGADSGAFRNKLTALKRYGLFDGRGTLEATELADLAMDEESDLYRPMLQNIDIINDAYTFFDGQPVPMSDWIDYLENIESGTGLDRTEATKLRRIYLKFVERVPIREPSKTPKETLDIEREFEYYIDKLENPNTRDAALNALKSRLSSKRLPGPGPLDKVIQLIKNEKYPDSQTDLFYLLKLISENNVLEQWNVDVGDTLLEPSGNDINNKYQEVVEILNRKLWYYSDPNKVEINRELLNTILKIQEVLRPEDLVENWWKLLTTRIMNRAEHSGYHFKKFISDDLSARLLTGNDSISNEFYEDYSEQAEDQLWQLMSEAEDEDIINECERILEMMGVI